jgi:tetratricopeptide (TPR) repeat protein
MADLEQLRRQAKQAYKTGDHAAAASAYAAILGEAGEGAGAAAAPDLKGYAAALVALNRLDEAAAQLRRVLVLAPDDVAARQKLASILSRLGRHREAADEFGEAVRLEPENADHYWRLASELRALGDENGARRAVARCLEVDPDNTHARIIEMELAYLGTPQAREEQEDLKIASEMAAHGPDIERPAPSPRLGRWMILVEAVGLLAFAFWVRSLFN